MLQRASRPAGHYCAIAFIGPKAHSETVQLMGMLYCEPIEDFLRDFALRGVVMRNVQSNKVTENPKVL